jgi:protein arginine N-methyltransferase 1
MAEEIADHIGWLADANRMRALRSAIDATVKPGDVVIDVGTGTGVLALMACAAGARRVYAIERGPIIELARKIVAANGCRDRVEFVRGLSTAVALPERGDVLVSDLLGPFSFEVGLWEMLLDARSRLLKPGGRTVPSAIALYLAPLEGPHLRERLAFAATGPGGFDMSALGEHARNTVYHLFPEADALLTGPIEILRCELPPASWPTVEATVTTSVTRDGLIDGVAGWFDAELSPGVNFSNAPTSDQRLDRMALVLPVSPPIRVRRDDTIAIEFRMLLPDRVLRWRVRRESAGQDPESFAGSTLAGLLISREDLATYEADRG